MGRAGGYLPRMLREAVRVGNAASAITGYAARLAPFV
jgi:hypothetical protein